MKSKHSHAFNSILNKKARFEYEVLDTLEAGIVLSGPEVKSIRLGRAQLQDSHVRIMDNQAKLLNLTIQPYPHARQEDYDPKHTRQLLLHKKEINKLIGFTEQKRVTLIPLKLYQHHNRIKLEIGICRGKKQFEKKESKKREDIKRDTLRHLKEATKYKG